MLCKVKQALEALGKPMRIQICSMYDLGCKGFQGFRVEGLGFGAYGFEKGLGFRAQQARSLHVFWLVVSS